MKRKIRNTEDLQAGDTVSDRRGRLLRIDRVSLATIAVLGPLRDRLNQEAGNES